MTSPAEPRVLFMSSWESTPSPTLPRRRSRSRADHQTNDPARITPLAGAPTATNSPLTAGRSVHRRATPSDPESLDEALRAIREQQRQDRNAIAHLNLLVTEQAKAVEVQRKWNEENAVRVLAMEGSI